MSQHIQKLWYMVSSAKISSSYHEVGIESHLQLKLLQQVMSVRLSAALNAGDSASTTETQSKQETDQNPPNV